jgi:hypothetical protein
MSNDRNIINVKRRADHLIADPVPCSGCSRIGEFQDLIPGASGGVFCLDCFDHDGARFRGAAIGTTFDHDAVAGMSEDLGATLDAFGGDS